MPIMDREHFWHILKTEFGYRSPRRRHLLSEKISGWATALFYARLIRLVYATSRTAERGSLTPEKWAEASFGVFKIIESVGGRIQISGLQGVVEHQRPLIYISNHMSMIDTLIMPCLGLAFSNLTFVVKEGLLSYPVFGAIMRAVHPIAVTRRNPREDFKTVLNRGQELLAKGYSVVIFPQATRSAVFDPASFNSLGVKLARKAGVSVVPVALKTDFQGNGRIIKEMGPITPRKTLYFTFGDPVAVAGGGQKTHQYIVDFILKCLQEWGGEVRGVPDLSGHARTPS